MTTTPLELDAAILGGGIAGLWTLASLRAAGYSAMLFENGQLGGVQTIASQGIIHGGIKYALTGAATRASKAISEMPSIWRTCLNGGAMDRYDNTDADLPDLRSARVLSESQYLWTTPGIVSRLMGVAASKAIRTSVERVPMDERPASLQTASAGDAKANAKVDVYRVDEPVLDVRSVVEALLHASGGPDTCVGYDTLKVTPGAGSSDSQTEKKISASIDSLMLGCRPHDSLADGASGSRPVAIRAKRYIFAAGAGNEHLLSLSGCDQAGSSGLAMQRRPLHMVMLRSAALPELFGHCTAMSDKPRITVTSSRNQQGRVVWYIGGQLAEQGVARDAEAQIACARKELRECLPWLDWSGLQDAQWATWRVDRAEGLMPDGSRPDEPVVVATGNVIAAWPTKLAFAPLVARRVRLMLEAHGVVPSRVSRSALLATRFLAPAIASYPWNRPEVAWTT